MPGNGKEDFEKYGINPYMEHGRLVWESPDGKTIGKLIITGSNSRKKNTVFLMPRVGSGFEGVHLKEGQGDL